MWRGVCLLWMCTAAYWSAANPAFPLKTVPGKHYLVDQHGTPFFIQGDAGWLVAKQLKTADQDYYLSNRWAQGFNAIMMDMHAYYSGGGTHIGGKTADAYGNLPFTNTIPGPYTNLLAINPNFMTNVDHVIQRAAQYGMLVFLYPMYDGAPGSKSGWWNEEQGNGSNVLYQYGQWVGHHYASYSNIIYVAAGDNLEPGYPNELWTSLAEGILSVESNALFTAQAAAGPGGENYPARGWYSNSWCNVNSTYARSPSYPYTTYKYALTNYMLDPVYPSFSREPYYEGTWYVSASTPYDIRRYAWGSVTYGEAGHFYGNVYMATYDFTNGWKGHLWSEGATNMTAVIKLMNTRPWWNCVPDANHTTITSGYGTYGQETYITCMREQTGKTVIAYVPEGSMIPTVDMTRISGTMANAWWYNPRNGDATAIGTYSTTGTRTFTPPDTNDWVLVLDDKSQAYPPPGVLLDPPLPPSNLRRVANPAN